MEMYRKPHAELNLLGPHGERVGSNVHYLDNQTRLHAAVVTRVNLDGTVCLHVFGTYHAANHMDLMAVSFSETYQENHWSWPYTT